VSVGCYEKFDRDLEQARSVSRDAIYRVSVLSASIVAFSATLLSIKQLHLSQREPARCKLVPLRSRSGDRTDSVALEARARYVITWRSLQPQDFDAERKLTRLERLQLLGVLLYSVRPSTAKSLLRDTHSDQ
jgi:hypothetical protein